MSLQKKYNEKIEYLNHLNFEKIKTLVELTNIFYEENNYPFAEKYINEAKEMNIYDLNICLNRLQVVIHTNIEEAEKEIEHIENLFSHKKIDILLQNQNKHEKLKKFNILKGLFYFYEEKFNLAYKLFKKHLIENPNDFYVYVLKEYSYFNIHKKFNINFNSLNEEQKLFVINEGKKLMIDYRLINSLLNFKTNNLMFYLIKIKNFLFNGYFQESYDLIEFLEKKIDKQNPVYPHLMDLKGETLLGLERYQEGFEYFYKYKNNIVNKDLIVDKQKYLNENINIENKTVLIITDQGFGDNFNYLKFINTYIEQHPKTKFILKIYKPLLELFKYNIHKNVKEFYIYETDTFEEITFDYIVKVSKLPYLTKLSNKEIINFNSPIKVQKNTKFDFLDNQPLKLIGIFWRTELRGLDMRMKSFNLETFQKIPEIKKLLDNNNKTIKLISLQIPINQIEKNFLFTNNILDMGNKLKNFNDTALLLDKIEELHTIDTGILNLAASMNKKCFVYLKDLICWRYGNFKEKSPFFYDVTVKKYGEWIQDNI